MLRLFAILSLLFVSSAALAEELPDPRGRWLNGEDVLEFTGKDTKQGRYTVEVNYMGMRVSSRGRWMQLKAGLLAWKITDINIGGAPGDSAMLPKAGDFMFGLFKKEGEQLKLFYEMKGFPTKKDENHPAMDKLEGGKLYTNTPKK
ncbi:hypothetical protein KKF91_06210 [Myxococcota bacterium]|nr:hypothetical protein [Myxococcota bacterium]MBU1430146.1 hypothetical protein [Myxococcota bacterium]MBU1900657.1 hypothetical protein [Myxococcota bacterium]